MAIRKVSEIGSKVIRSRAKEILISEVRKLGKLITDLTDTMRHENLVGIAAPQIGVASRVFLTEVRKTKFRKNLKELDPLRVFINPKILTKSSKLTVGYEGCGSVAHGQLFGTVKRVEAIRVRALNEKGEPFTLDVKGLLARIVQHEIDHLNGVCFIDHVTNTRKLLGQNEYMKMKKKKHG